MFYSLECQFVEKFNIKCREFQLILRMTAVAINSTQLNDLLHAIGNENYVL